MTRDAVFEQLVDAHYAQLYRFALNLSASPAEASDLTQQTFLIWARKGHQVRDERKVKSWLFTTLHREFLQGRRRLVRFPQVELSEAEPELPPGTPLDLSRVDRETIQAAVRGLDSQFRAAISLFYLEDYSYGEIAEILGVPLGTVKSRISRGITQLQHALIASAEVCGGGRPG